MRSGPRREEGEEMNRVREKQERRKDVSWERAWGSAPGKGKGQRTAGGEALKRKQKRAKVREGRGL